MTTFGFCYVTHLPLNKDEAVCTLEKFKEKDEEICGLVFLKKDPCEIEEFCKREGLVDYLKPVLQDYMKINQVTEFEKCGDPHLFPSKT